MILWYWRKENTQCEICRRTICHCPSWCKCTTKQIADFYNKKYNWVIPKTITPIDPSKKQTLWEAWAEWQSMDIRWPMFWSFLHEIPYCIGSSFTKNDIHIFFVWFATLLCTDCKWHADEFIKNNIDIVKDNDNKSLIEFVNNFHNYVNERYWKKSYTIEESLLFTSWELIKKWKLKRWMLYQTNWLQNI